MTDRPFRDYADYYDRLYQAKDYAAEADFLEAAFRRHSPVPVETVLDLGCGTGGHALILHARGYRPTGVDASAEMIEIARAKAATRGAPVDFVVEDMRRVALGRTFDAAVCMFAALGYVTGTDDLIAALRAIRRHLRPGGLFVADVWNGLAVLRILPETRLKTVRDGDLEILRYVQPELDAPRQVCHDRYRLIARQGDRVLADIQEMHTMRFFFPLELSHYLADAGFEVIEIVPAPGETADRIDESVWNLAIVARAAGGAAS